MYQKSNCEHLQKVSKQSCSKEIENLLNKDTKTWNPTDIKKLNSWHNVRMEATRKNWWTWRQNSRCKPTTTERKEANCTIRQRLGAWRTVRSNICLPDIGKEETWQKGWCDSSWEWIKFAKMQTERLENKPSKNQRIPRRTTSELNFWKSKEKKNHEINLIKNDTLARWWWHIPLVSALRSQSLKTDLWVQGQSALQSNFWDSQEHTEKPYLDKEKPPFSISSKTHSCVCAHSNDLQWKTYSKTAFPPRNRGWKAKKSNLIFSLFHVFLSSTGNIL